MVNTRESLMLDIFYYAFWPALKGERRELPNLESNHIRQMTKD